MSLLDRVRALHVADLSHFLPLRVDGERIGWVRRASATRLAPFADVFRLENDAVHVVAAPASRTAAFERVARALVADGVLDGWRDEAFPVVRRWGEEPRFLVDRGCATFFGIPGFGIHLNGYVPGPDGLRVWVGRRSAAVRVAPGKLDHLVAGGQPHGLTLEENLAKECAEEASIPLDLAARAVPAGSLHYRLETDRGLKDDTIFIYDLELPAEFVPANTDGEVEGFELWTTDRLLARVRDTDDFKFNVGPVIVDFLMRHGCLGPDDPEHEDLLEAFARDA